MADGYPASPCSNVEALAAAWAASFAAAFRRVALMVVEAIIMSGIAPQASSNQSTTGSSTI
jgi:hypothetical protein